MAKGIQNMAGHTEYGNPLVTFCYPSIPHTLCGGYIIWRYTGAFILRSFFREGRGGLLLLAPNISLILK